MAVGGYAVSCTLDGRNFPILADADLSRHLGGDSNEVSPNGDSSARIIKTKMPWQVEGFTVECDDSRGDHEFLQALADRNDFWPATVTYVDDSVYAGQATISGDLRFTNQNAAAAFGLAGPKKLEKQ